MKDSNAIVAALFQEAARQDAAKNAEKRLDTQIRQSVDQRLRAVFERLDKLEAGVAELNRTRG
jgi:hypothetical protein